MSYFSTLNLISHPLVATLSLAGLRTFGTRREVAIAVSAAALGALTGMGMVALMLSNQSRIFKPVNDVEEYPEASTILLNLIYWSSRTAATALNASVLGIIANRFNLD